MSNPFSALDFSDDENITVVKPAEAKAEKKIPAGKDTSQKHNPPRKELQAQEAVIRQTGVNKPRTGGQRGSVPQPEVAHPGERSKSGVAKEHKPDTHKQPAEGERRGRQFDRHSGTGRGREVKKGGAGGRNWGKPGDEQAPLPPATPDAEGAAPGEAEVAQPPVEEDPSLTLEEYEKLKAAKRVGAAFEEKEARKVSAPIEGKVYKKDEQEGEGVYIKLGEDDNDLKKKPGHFKSKQKQVFEVDLKVRDSSAAEAPAPRRGGRPEFGRGGGAPRGDRPPREDRPARDSAPRGDRPPRGEGAPRGDRPPRSEGGAPRGGSAAPRRGGAPAGATGRIDTADQSAFPKLGGSA